MDYIDNLEASIHESLSTANGPMSLGISGLSGASKAWFITKLSNHFNHLAILSKDRKASLSLLHDLEVFLTSRQQLNLSAWDTLPFENVSPQIHISAKRLETLNFLCNSAPYTLLLSPDSLLQRVLPAKILEQLTFTLSLGQTVSKLALVQELNLLGYCPVHLVEEIGDIAVRGEVVDLFPSGHTFPIRIQIIADQIKSINYFDQNSQRSLTNQFDSLNKLKVLPVRENLSLAYKMKSIYSITDAHTRISARAKELETPPQELRKALDTVAAPLQVPAAELIDVIGFGHLGSIFDYLAQDTLFVVIDKLQCTQNLDSFWELVTSREQRLASEHYLIPKKEQLYLSSQEALDKIAKYRTCFLEHIETVENTQTKSINVKTISNLELKTKLKTKVGSGNAFRPLAQAINSWRAAQYRIAFVIGSQNRAERLKRILLELNLDADIVNEGASAWLSTSAPMAIIHGALSDGCQIPNAKLVFIAEHEIFPERSYRKSTSSKVSLKKLMSTLSQLSENDHVVHIDFGIGLYRGLKHLEIEDVESDFLQIDYADSKLYLPIQNINKIQKFFASEGQVPTLDKLSSQRWSKTKQKIRESIISLAGDLIRLYATRSISKGWCFDPSGAEDERFADDFPFNETPDQLKAIEETLSDLASEKPMDRLICGDVGFGKTEVAMRAAYKCLQHGRQVALLVPTTILAEQHRLSFSNRFRDYPVKVAALSRFYSAEQNKASLAGVQSGDIDIIVGTHRLLQRDVTFNDLGLLIIDEEHRFGVKQKEKLKQIKKNVDVLSLTATPIPRTLHMSLLGIRDISIISTPPQDRMVIRTYIASFDEALVRDAILREKQRSGQIFFVHNRIESIGALTARLAELVPEVSFEFAHGQMGEHQLERIMQRFLAGEIDCLVSTTIIESGLDIPNANTIIIERADALGLAQLYQLRGRVGRSDRQAYAYLLIPKVQRLSTDAQRRLKALQSLDDLGLGFNLAARDLEIRGAGNLLGKEQHGNVLAVGFELYSKILKEAVLNLKGQDLSIDESIDPEIKFPLNAYIPEYYVPDISERLVLYQRLASIVDCGEADQMADEMQDRFGTTPPEVDNLIELMRLRTLLKHYGVVHAEFNELKFSLAFDPRAPINAEKVLNLVKTQGQRYRFSKNHTLVFTQDPQNKINPHAIRRFLENLFGAIGK